MKKAYFSLYLEHNDDTTFPDQLLSYRPLMSWIELVSNFGGLLGMWLGFSALFIVEYVMKLIKF